MLNKHDAINILVGFLPKGLPPSLCVDYVPLLQPDQADHLRLENHIINIMYNVHRHNLAVPFLHH